MRYVLLALVLFASPAAALEPKDVFVLANKSMPASRDVAEHYLAKRGVPRENLILLDLPTGEDISRSDYDAKLAAPLRAALKDRKDAAKVLLSVYGVPLRVGEVELTAAQKAEGEKLVAEVAAAKKVLDELVKDKADAKAVADARRRHIELDEKWRVVTHNESTACVDSELMLLWWPEYPLRRWVPNPLYFQASEKYRKANPPVLMTSRLDGPSPEIAKRLVDDAVAVEAKGLDGLAVIDARGIKFDPKGDSGHAYGGYDESMRETAKLFEKTPLPVTL
ncbi:MAG TPA: TIGR03790 family protein, partial [Gemmataceae bacterium]|nr:TIGR03790 family protein [Gemmataceae bacterium]